MALNRLSALVTAILISGGSASSACDSNKRNIEDLYIGMSMQQVYDTMGAMGKNGGEHKCEDGICTYIYSEPDNTATRLKVRFSVEQASQISKQIMTKLGDEDILSSVESAFCLAKSERQILRKETTWPISPTGIQVQVLFIGASPRTGNIFDIVMTDRTLTKRERERVRQEAQQPRF